MTNEATILCKTRLLLDALSAVKGAAAPARSAIQALSGVRVTSDKAGTRVRCADFDVSFERHLTVEERSGEFDVLVPLKLLMDAVSLFDGFVGLYPRGDELELWGGSRKISLRTGRLEDFPSRPSLDGKPLLRASGAELAKVIERAALFASGDETRPILCAMHVLCTAEQFRVVATDSYRLCALGLPGEQLASDARVNVHGRGLRLAAKAMRREGVVDVAVGPQHTILSWPLTTIAVRNVEGQFPDYDKLFPSEFPSQITIPVSELRSACKMAVKMLSHNAPVRVYANEQVKLHGFTPDVGSFEDNLTGATPSIAGGEIEIGFNPDFLLDIASVLEGETCVLQLISALRPGLVEQGDDKYLLMPIRLNV